MNRLVHTHVHESTVCRVLACTEFTCLSLRGLNAVSPASFSRAERIDSTSWRLCEDETDTAHPYTERERLQLPVDCWAHWQLIDSPYRYIARGRGLAPEVHGWAEIHPPIKTGHWATAGDGGRGLECVSSKRAQRERGTCLHLKCICSQVQLHITLNCATAQAGGRAG